VVVRVVHGRNLKESERAAKKRGKPETHKHTPRAGLDQSRPGATKTFQAARPNLCLTLTFLYVKIYEWFKSPDNTTSRSSSLSLAIAFTSFKTRTTPRPLDGPQK
jgi:hypothetical protein